MAGGWERRSAIAHVDAETIARLLAPRWPGARVTSAELLAGGLANTNYRVTLNAYERPVVVRFYTRDADACAREVALLRHVAGVVPVPEPLYVAPTDDPFAHPYVVLSWLDGTPLIDVLDGLTADEAPALAAALGEMAARIGSFSFPEAGFLAPDLSISEQLLLGPAGLRTYLRQMLVEGRAGERLGSDVTQRLLAQIEEKSPLVEPLASQHALIHADFKDGNILVERNADGWRVTGVLDWEFSFVGASLFDIGMLLRREETLPPGFAAACIESYRAHGGFAPRGWRTMTLLMDLINLCDFLTAEGARPGMHADVSRLIGATLARLERGEADEGD